MLIVISPAKTLDFATPPTTRRHTQPEFISRAQQLNQVLRQYEPDQLGKLMSISNELAELNVARNRMWQTPFTVSNAKQALFAFRGDVYTGMNADSFDAKDLDFAQKHLRILSGLYGLLCPLDLIQPYRLEMGTRLANQSGKDLYAFWDETITKALNQTLNAHKNKVLVNLASEEYFSAVRSKQLAATICTPVFRDFKNGQYKVISFFAKKARGTMAAWVIKNRIKTLRH
jgi:cytoplasmic iron level regulating protein YaaA (DUF328/UPF0246 family)